MQRFFWIDLDLPIPCTRLPAPERAPVLSIRTVERHITNIYGKINARGRADAAAYALGHEMIDRK